MLFEKGLTKTLETYEKWWAGELNRPLVPIVLTGHKPDRSPPKHFYEGQKSFGNRSISPEELVDGIDYELKGMEFIGDAYPLFNCTYSGPGIVAAFLGADVTVDSGNIWFFPAEELPIEELHFEYQKDNYWFNRIKATMAEAKRRFGDSVVIGMPDLGGIMDILATFRGTENLLMDLYDSPEEVIRAVNQIKKLWHRYYDELRAYTTEGYHTDWSSILSGKRSYMTQSDFCYMLGSDMFEQFIRDELVSTCAFLERGCYHLDGVGQIPFLDSLMKIEGMDLIQWVPGDGPYATADWLDLYCKVLDAGKHLQITYDPNYKALDDLVAHYGSGKRITTATRHYPLANREQVYEVLARYGAR